MASADSTRPPPRRKSCGECVKAKRRCDQRLPTCLRCTKKGLHCEYVARPDRSNDFLQQMQFDLTTESLPAPFPEPIEDFSNPSTFDLATDIDLTAPLDLSWLPEVSLVEQESTLNNMNWVFETPKEMALAAPSMGRGGECCITGASEYAIETYDKICVWSNRAPVFRHAANIVSVVIPIRRFRRRKHTPRLLRRVIQEISPHPS